MLSTWHGEGGTGSWGCGKVSPGSSPSLKEELAGSCTPMDRAGQLPAVAVPPRNTSSCKAELVP